MDAGLRDVAVRDIEIRTEFASFEDYSEPLLSGQGPSGSYAASLADAQRTALRTKLLSLAPRGRPGLSLNARAWAVRGRYDTLTNPAARRVVSSGLRSHPTIVATRVAARGGTCLKV